MIDILEQRRIVTDNVPLKTQTLRQSAHTTYITSPTLVKTSYNFNTMPYLARLEESQKFISEATVDAIATASFFRPLGIYNVRSVRTKDMVTLGIAQRLTNNVR